MGVTDPHYCPKCCKNTRVFYKEPTSEVLGKYTCTNFYCKTPGYSWVYYCRNCDVTPDDDFFYPEDE